MFLIDWLLFSEKSTFLILQEEHIFKLELVDIIDSEFYTTLNTFMD